MKQLELFRSFMEVARKRERILGNNLDGIKDMILTKRRRCGSLILSKFPQLQLHVPGLVISDGSSLSFDLFAQQSIAV